MYLNILVYLLLIWQAYEAERIVTTLKYSSHRVKPVVVNGSPVSRGAVPYIVSIKTPIRLKTTVVYRSLCGGSIIGTNKVLTAAHCFEDNDFKLAKYPERLAVVAGDLRNEIDVVNNNEITQWRKVRKVRIHPDFIFPVDDIAIVFVSLNWGYTNWVSPIKYATRTIDYPDTCYASGYGRTSHGVHSKRSSVLLRAKIGVMRSKKCSEIWEVTMDDFICTYSRTTDVAEGDSGGPLACRNTSDPNEEPGKELLVGVTSAKNYDMTSIFTRVSSYKDWIESTQYNQGCNMQNWCLVFYVVICLINL